MALHTWRLISVCAGVGGLDLGVRLAEPEARSVCYVEREAHAAAILVARMEEGWLDPAAVWSDLATFNAGEWRGAVNCVVSGDPCQGNSVAGKQLGADDERWLIDRLLRVVDDCRPDRVFRENVPGNAEGQLDALISPLERLGFRCAVGIFSTSEAGGAHDRERLLVMADASSPRLPWSERLGGHSEQAGERCSSSLGSAAERSAVSGEARDPWHAEPQPARTADEVADRVERLRACGNGVDPLVAGYAWRTLEARLAADRAVHAALRAR